MTSLFLVCHYNAGFDIIYVIVKEVYKNDWYFIDEPWKDGGRHA